MPKRKPKKRKNKPPRRKIGRGGYPKEIVRFAFGRYCKGETTSEIASRLRLHEDCKTVSKKTVDRWRTRHGWEELKKQANEKVFKQDMPAIVQEMQDDLKTLSDLKQKLKDEIPEAKAGSIEGISYALTNAIRTQYKLLGMNLDRSEPDKSGKNTFNIEKAIIHSGELNLEELSRSSRRIDVMMKNGEIEMKTA